MRSHTTSTSRASRLTRANGPLPPVTPLLDSAQASTHSIEWPLFLGVSTSRYPVGPRPTPLDPRSYQSDLSQRLLTASWRCSQGPRSNQGAIYVTNHQLTCLRDGKETERAGLCSDSPSSAEWSNVRNDRTGRATQDTADIPWVRRRSATYDILN
ncbi:hypothetical protein GY45DRAFT_946988 [Cubamyces sp. BRFM 1775]|nr:hypothetical protein GY45DRAFT_946988 [Cubamyces sp. BRFM 1775]